MPVVGHFGSKATGVSFWAGAQQRRRISLVCTSERFFGLRPQDDRNREVTIQAETRNWPTTSMPHARWYGARKKRTLLWVAMRVDG